MAILRLCIRGCFLPFANYFNSFMRDIHFESVFMIFMIEIYDKTQEQDIIFCTACNHCETAA